MRRDRSKLVPDNGGPLRIRRVAAEFNNQMQLTSGVVRMAAARS